MADMAGVEQIGQSVIEMTQAKVAAMDTNARVVSQYQPLVYHIQAYSFGDVAVVVEFGEELTRYRILLARSRAVDGMLVDVGTKLYLSYRGRKLRSTALMPPRCISL